MEVFNWPVRVYYEDTDSGGVVYHANYLNFFERARTEWLRSLGVEQDRLVREEGVIFAVRHIEMDFIKPARFNDLLNVTTRIANQGRASLLFQQQMIKQDSGTELELCRATVKVACLHAESFRPTAIPTFIQTEIARVC